MTEIQIAYRPLVFPEFTEGENRNRVSRSMLIQRMEAEANADFLKKGIINPFEEALLASDREEFNTGEFVIEVNEGRSSPTTKWRNVYDSLSAFLDVRADDSRAATYDGVKFFDGVGYCLRVQDLQNHLGKLIKDETSKPGKTRSLKWPSKKRSEEYPTEVTLPDGSFYRVTRQNGRAVLQAKRVVSGITANVVKPYKAELQRWFEAETGYAPPKAIPNEEIGHDERMVEFAKGSYGRVQLVREENPKYKDAIAKIQSSLQDMRDLVTVQQFRSTNDDDGTPYVNIKSVRGFLNPESLRENDLVEVDSRYNITP
ncbi:MAG: hypothetical protein ABIH92_05110 [Nanoarchaeota archaeon]